MYGVFAAALSVPAKLTVPAPSVIEVSVGKFCRLFAPLSASSASFWVRPLFPRSIPSPPKTCQSLPRIALPVPLTTLTPFPVALNWLAAPAAVPPMVLLLEATETAAPPTGEPASPMTLPWMTLPFAVSIVIPLPAKPVIPSPFTVLAA